MDFDSSIDPLVIPMVEYFNEHGLKTHMSCQGHNKTNMSMFWISFDKTVTDKDIEKFMQTHLDWRGTFCICGRFAERMLGNYSVVDKQWKVAKSWNYFAATHEAAASDLMQWQSSENKWEGFDGERYKQWISELKSYGKI